MNFMNIMVIIFCIIAGGAGLIGYFSEYFGSGKNLKDENEKADKKDASKEYDFGKNDNADKE